MCVFEYMCMRVFRNVCAGVCTCMSVYYRRIYIHTHICMSVCTRMPANEPIHAHGTERGRAGGICEPDLFVYARQYARPINVSIPSIESIKTAVLPCMTLKRMTANERTAVPPSRTGGKNEKNKKQKNSGINQAKNPAR